MAILHRAWTFDAEVAADHIASVMRAGGLPSLRKAAQRVIADRATETAATLAELRFDPEWIAPPDAMSDRAVESVVILLASQLTPAPSVTRHVELQRAMSMAGSMAGEIDLLLRGRPLETMFDRSDERVLAGCIAGIGQYGGWISRAEAASLRQRLDALATPVAGQALQEARSMLDAARDRNADLFVLLD